MATDTQIHANRKNAQHSTGPRTEAGKAISARNALTLGLFTERDYVRPKEQAKYDELCARCVTELNPEGVLEETFVATIISASWRQRRCSLVEREHAKHSHRDPMSVANLESFQNSVDRARSQATLQLRRATIELRRLQTDRVLARKLLSNEVDLPRLVNTKQIVTTIDQHGRAQPMEAQSHQQKSGLNSNRESPRSYPHDNRSQTPRNGRCPCGSGEKFKRCCLRGAQSARPYPHDDPKKPKNPGQDAPPVLGPVEKAA